MLRRKSLRGFATVFIIAMGLVVSAAVMAAPVKLTLLHLNDWHGRIDSFVTIKDQPPVGGAARIATIIKQTKQSNPNTLVLSAGDCLHGTNLVNLDKGVFITDLMNAMGFSAMAVGNHDFNYGIDQLLVLQARSGSRMKLLAAGLESDLGFNPLASAREINIGGVDVVIIGVATPETPILTHPDNVAGYTFPDPVEAVAKYVGIFRDYADVVVVLSHAGFETDKVIAEKVKGIDVIIGGHSHTVLEKPIRVGNAMVTQAGEYGQLVGRVDITVDDDKVTSVEGSFIPVSATIAEDAEIAKLVSEHKAGIDKSLAGVVGKAGVLLDGNRANVRSKETNLGNLVADIIRIAGKAEIAIMNGGGIRDNINEGDITISEVFTALPFDNTLVTVKLSGAQIVQAIENGVSEWEKGSGRFPQVSGVSFSFNPTLPIGKRVLSVSVAGVPIDAAKYYTVATNDFMAAGGDGYAVFKTAERVMLSNQYLRELMIDYIAYTGTVSPAIEGRITIVK